MLIAYYLLDILKYALAGLAIFFTAFYTLRPYLDGREKLKLLELKKEAIGHILPLRLQAYERIILYIERINPANMLIRLHAAGMSAAEMQQLVLTDIRAEYQHNMAQQLYVSSGSWEVVKKIKEDTIALINTAAGSLPPQASSVELSKAVLMHLSALETSPYDAALKLIRQDIELLF